MMMRWYRNLRDIEVVDADAGSEGRDDVADLLGGEGLVESGLLDIENLASEGEDRLEDTIPSLLGRAAGRVSLDEKELAVLGVALLALRELAGKAGAVECSLAPGEVPGLASGLAGAGSLEAFRHDAFGVGRPFLEKGGELLVHEDLDDPLDVGVAQAPLGLALELRFGHLDAHDRTEALSCVLSLDLVVRILRQARCRGVGIHGTREGTLQAHEVRAAIVGVDVVGEGVDVLLVAVVPL